MNEFARPSFRRRTYLLTGFQSRFAFAFVVSIVLIAGGTAFVMSWFLRRSPREAALFINLYRELSRSWIIGAALLLVSALTILFILMVMTLHRVAGPIFVMTRYLNELAAGRYPVMRPLRSSDELTDFFDALKRMSERLQRRSREEARALRDLLGVVAALSPAPQHQDVINRLKAVFADKLRAAEPPSESPARAGAGVNQEASAPRTSGQASQGGSSAPSSANQASTQRAAGQAPPGLKPAPTGVEHQASVLSAPSQAPQSAAPAPSSADHQASTPRGAGQAPPGLTPARAGAGLNREGSAQVRAPVPVTTGSDE